MNRILLVRVGALGDTLMATPAVRALKNRHPQAEIDFLCSETAAPLLELNPCLARMFRIRRRNLPYALSYEKHRLSRQLHARDYDAAFLFETAPRYHQLLRRAGLSRIESFNETPFDPGMHCIVNYLRVAGFPDSQPEDYPMDLAVGPADDEAAGKITGRLKRPWIGLHAGYGPRGKKDNQANRLKGWPLENFLRLSWMLLECGASLVFTGSAEDRDDIASISLQLPQDRIVSTAGNTRILEFAAILKNLDLFISVDTGPAHMAAALGVPLIVLWGPAIYEQVRPVASSSPVRILRIPPPCAPCYGTPRKKSCKKNICMENISPDCVLEAARDLLSTEILNKRLPQ